MRVLFAGTPALAVPAFRELAEVAEVRAVLTNPDAPSGRGARVLPSPVKEAARELGIPSLEPERLDLELYETVRGLGAELLVVVAYGRIFKPGFLALFARGGVNLHPSLLPRHRGPTPIPATILAGDAEAGVTIQRVAAAVDSGAILAQERVPLDGSESASVLTARLAPLGARLLAEVVRAIESGTVVEKEQEHASATFCRKLAKTDGEIDWQEDARTIWRKVRAYDTYPGTHTTYSGRLLHILEAEPLDAPGQPAGATAAAGGPAAVATPSRPFEAPGVVAGVDKRYGILVHTGLGFLCVRRLQLEARKSLDWRSFVNGVPGFLGSRLGGI